MAEQRRRLAVEAAVEVAGALGLGVERPLILHDSNNTLVRLAPAPIVAKVGTSHFRDAKLESLERELAVATHLAEREAPVVRPAREVPSGPHRCGRLTVTLWRYAEPLGAAGKNPEAIAAALRAVHQGLVEFPGFLPPFDLELDDARSLLRPERSPTLAAADRRFLRSVVDEVQAALPATGTYRPLHGSPHAGNWLLTAQGPRLLDFETACRGPVEWDLAALGDEAVDLFPGVDRDLVSLLRRMGSVCVAAKCWVQPDRAPEVLEAAHVHLKLLRGERLD